MNICNFFFLFKVSILISSVDNEFILNQDNINNPFFRDDSYVFIDESKQDLNKYPRNAKGKKRSFLIDLPSFSHVILM